MRKLNAYLRMTVSYLKFENDTLLDKISFRSTNQKKIIKGTLQWTYFRHTSVFVGVLHRMMLVCYTHASQFME